MCAKGERKGSMFLLGIRNGAWSLGNGKATGSDNYLSIPVAKRCYCCCICVERISVKLLAIDCKIHCIGAECLLLTQGVGGGGAGWTLQKTGLLRHCGRPEHWGQQKSTPTVCLIHLSSNYHLVYFIITPECLQPALIIKGNGHKTGKINK